MNTFSNFPIDAVIAWVDGGDENHQKKILPYLRDKKIISNKKVSNRNNIAENLMKELNQSSSVESRNEILESNFLRPK